MRPSKICERLESQRINVGRRRDWRRASRTVDQIEGYIAWNPSRKPMKGWTGAEHLVFGGSQISRFIPLFYVLQEQPYWWSRENKAT
jgi:hypothetical protein